jgi:hypothetical protein
LPPQDLAVRTVRSEFQNLRREDWELQASLGYIARPCLKKKSRPNKTNKQTKKHSGQGEKSVTDKGQGLLQMVPDSGGRGGDYLGSTLGLTPQRRGTVF